MKKYTTISGDAFDLIAYKQMGDCRYVVDLMNANREYLTTLVFKAGHVINIPEISESTTSKRIPPWRKKS